VNAPVVCHAVRRGRLLLAALAALVVAPALAADARAPDPVRIGGRLHFALRTGFGLPLGRYANVQALAGVQDEDNAIADDTYGVIPIWFDAGYRLSDHLLLGGYFMFGIVLPKTAPADNPLGGGCPEGFDCFATGVRLGVQAQYSFAPEGMLDPWLGVGMGYEWVSTQLEGEVFSFPFESSTRYSGPDLLQLQGGVDFHTRSIFSVGPFGSVSAMRYTSCSLTLAGEESRCELEEGGWHGWLVLGMRGVVEL
jgi:opacity protein-like surface antigen